MIIASLAKKEISIPLQTMTSTVVSSSFNKLKEEQQQEEEVTTVDVVTINNRNQHGSSDFISQVFGQNYSQVNEILNIKTARKGYTALTCEAFIFNDTVFINSNSNYYWSDGGEFQTCITHLIELAEEKTGCNTLVFIIAKHQYKDNLSTLLRAFMYLGFEMINPSIYRQEPGYVLVGYEL